MSVLYKPTQEIYRAINFVSYTDICDSYISHNSKMAIAFTYYILYSHLNFKFNVIYYYKPSA